MEKIFKYILEFIGIAIIWLLILTDFGERNIENIIKTIILVVLAIFLIRLRK